MVAVPEPAEPKGGSFWVFLKHLGEEDQTVSRVMLRARVLVRRCQPSGDRCSPLNHNMSLEPYHLCETQHNHPEKHSKKRLCKRDPHLEAQCWVSHSISSTGASTSLDRYLGLTTPSIMVDRPQPSWASYLVLSLFFFVFLLFSLRIQACLHIKRFGSAQFLEASSSLPPAAGLRRRLASRRQTPFQTKAGGASPAHVCSQRYTVRPTRERRAPGSAP